MNFEISDDGEISVEVKRITFGDDFSHWEASLYHNEEIICHCTGPTFWSALDCVLESLTDEGSLIDPQWLNADANKN